MRMSFDTLVERARAAERSGFDGIAFMDHLAPPLAEHHDMWEAMTAAAWVLGENRIAEGRPPRPLRLAAPPRCARPAGRQSRPRLRRPVRARHRLGVGHRAELTTFGVGVRSRPACAVERLGGDARRSWRRCGPASRSRYEGRHFTLDGAQQRPRPTKPIPVIIGGTGRRTIELVARHATWWNVPLHQLDQMEERRTQAGDARVSVQQLVAYVADESHRATVRPSSSGGSAAWRGTDTRVLLGERRRDRRAARRDPCDRGVERFYSGSRTSPSRRHSPPSVGT